MLLIISIIVQVIIEMRAFWLVENDVLSRYNQLARGDYSRALNFEMAASRFVNVTEEEINTIKENSVPKNTKDATKFGVTLFKGKISSFCWLN